MQCQTGRIIQAIIMAIHLVGGLHEQPHAIDTKICDHNQAYAPEDETRVPDGHGQCEHTNANVALQDMDDGFKVPAT
jgi:hypothetical protein